MTLKMLALSAATAAFMATGVLAQTTTPATPPADAPAMQTAPADGAPAMQTAPADGAATTTTTTTTTEAIQFTTSPTADHMLVSDLTGTAVRNSADENLGNISDIVVDQSGKAAVAIIGVGGFLGIGEKSVGVPFEALEFTMSNESNKRVARLDVTKEALEAAPAFVAADDTTARAPVRTQ